MAFRVDIADYVLGTLKPHDLPEVCVRALGEGYESSSLAALAGLPKATYNRWEAEELWSSALRELGLTSPTRDEAAAIIIDDCVTRVVRGEMHVEAAVRRIVHGAYYASRADERNVKVAGDSLGLKEIVGLYWQYDEVDSDIVGRSVVDLLEQPWSPNTEELDREGFGGVSDFGGGSRGGVIARWPRANNSDFSIVVLV